MRRMAWCAAAIGLIVAANASATVIATLSGVGGADTIEVLPSGGTFDLTVTLTRDLADGGAGVTSVQMDFVASSELPFSVELLGVQGAADSSGTGTRYNEAEWDADVVNSVALDPDLAAGAVTDVPRGPYGSSAIAWLWTSTSSVLGHIKVVVGPMVEGQTITLSPANVLAFPDYDTQFDDIIGNGAGVTFVGIPEPATMGLMLLASGLLLRRRR